MRQEGINGIQAKQRTRRLAVAYLQCDKQKPQTGMRIGCCGESIQFLLGLAVVCHARRHNTRTRSIHAHPDSLGWVKEMRVAVAARCVVALVALVA